MNTWKIIYTHFNPEEENLRESLCTLGNGYFGVRGAVPENTASKVHYPGMYIAGVYNSSVTKIAGKDIVNEDFVNCPNWLMVNFKIDDGPWFNRMNVRILSWKMELNLKKGILSRRIRWQDDQGRITLVESHRIISMSNPHCGGLLYSITPENYDAVITIRTGIDGSVVNAGVERYKQLNFKHLSFSDYGSFGEDGIYLQMKTSQSNIKITQAMRTLIRTDYKYDEKIEKKVILYGRQKIFHEIQLKVTRLNKYTIEKLVSVYTSRDHGVDDTLTLAQETVKQILNFDSLYKPHVATWKALWKRFDVEVEGDDFVQLVLRLHAFHLLQVASKYNEEIDAGMPARGLHGEAYRGHIFWDELYVFPFYTLHAPEITKALLMYRYRRLAAAKEYASKNGYKGAMFPWQSASLGDETAQVVHLNPMSGEWGTDYSYLQRHVSIAVAYNVWNYYYTAGDKDFLDRYGAEIMLEISHFWSSICKNNNKTKKYEIHNVMGPDEFHEKYKGSQKGGINNNAYTNVMVVWVLGKTLYILSKLLIEEDRNALLAKTGISEEEVKRWEDIVKKMYVPMGEDGLIYQFDGYMDLKEFPWEEYRSKYDNIRRADRILKAEGLSSDDYKVSKQADTLMLFYVLNFKELSEIFKKLGYPFSKEIMRKNFDYYFPRTSHGSTLSMVVHAYVADLVGIKDKSKGFLIEALRSDIYDTQGGTTQEGIHAGVMGGTIDLFYKTFGGLEILDDRICLNPALPKEWKSLKFNIRYKNIWFNIFIDHTKARVTASPIKGMFLHPVKEILIEVNKKQQVLLAGVQTIICI